MTSLYILPDFGDAPAKNSVRKVVDNSGCTFFVMSAVRAISQAKTKLLCNFLDVKHWINCKRSIRWTEQCQYSLSSRSYVLCIFFLEIVVGGRQLHKTYWLLHHSYSGALKFPHQFYFEPFPRCRSTVEWQTTQCQRFIAYALGKRRCDSEVQLWQHFFQQSLL